MGLGEALGGFGRVLRVVWGSLVGSLGGLGGHRGKIEGGAGKEGKEGK